MKSLGKNILVVLTLGILLTSLLSASQVQASEASSSSSIQERIDHLEDDIEAGVIIEDGNIGETKDVVENSSISLSSLTGKVGNFITRLIGKILEFFAKLFGSLVS